MNTMNPTHCDVVPTSLKNKFRKEREANKVTPITINTRVPSKWRFVDLETGEVWTSLDGKTFSKIQDVYVTYIPNGAPH